jgi:predicted short-subunit dehydrogenase-like oxidoreductase (DUF2520 family)
MKPESKDHLRVFVFGAGNAGRGLARALRRAGVSVTLRAARAGFPQRVDADLVVLAVRDGELSSLARRMATTGTVDARAAVVHLAGALGPEVLSPLRDACAGVGQMHPLASFAARSKTPRLEGVSVHILGDRTAVARARRAARCIGMKPWTCPSLDAARYHAAAGLIANGAAALSAVATELLVAAGVSRERAPGMIGPLLRSVGDNIEALGLPGALTGPVRRGDVATVERHIQAIRATVPEAFDLYLASARAQLVLARQIKDASPADLERIGRMLESLLSGRE